MSTSASPRHCAVATVVAIAIMLMAASGSTMADPVPRVKITEPRNAATGFAITLWMASVDALGTHCSTLEKESGKPFSNALESWKSRNAKYVDAALKYMVEREDDIAANQGEKTRQKFHDDRRAEFITATHAVEAVWFPDGKIDGASCRAVASHAADGSMDLHRNAEFFPVLQEIRADRDGPAR